MIRLPVQNEPWLAVLPHDSAAALGSARLCPGIEVAATVVEIWLRGPHLTPEIAAALKGVSGLEWREPFPGGRWRRPNNLLPGGSLPSDLIPADWRPLSQALVPEVPDATLAEPLRAPITLRVIPGGREHESNLLLLPLDELAAWTGSAPGVRMKPLRFAVNTGGMALVHGTPLPPLKGESWWESGGIALPCGFHLDPHLSPEIVRELLGLPSPQGGLVLLHPPGSFELIPAETLVSLNRGSVRMSVALRKTEKL